MYKPGIVFSSCLFFLISFGNMSLQGKPGGNQQQQIEALNQRLEQNLLKSNQHLENSEFQKAEFYADELMTDLDFLLEALMPLDERINQLIENEEIILKQTRNIGSAKSFDTNGSKTNSKLEDLIFQQIKNREKTNVASTITAKGLESTKKKQSVKDGKKPVDPKSVKKTLQEVKTLLDKSTIYQTAAIDNLEERDFSLAESKELNALDTLKKALEKLRQKSQSQSNQQKQDQKQESASNQQSQDQVGKKKKDDQKTQPSNQQKKMDPKEALKELIKLRKQAREEQERRKRQFGVQSTEEHFSVEKDW